MARRKKNSHAKSLFTLVVFLVVVIAAIVTCPTREEHQQALMDKLESYSQEKLEQVKEKNEILGTALQIGKDILKQNSVDKLLGLGIDQFLVVDDYYVFSVGRLMQGDHEAKVSFGVFGKVFTPSSEAIDKAIKSIR